MNLGNEVFLVGLHVWGNSVVEMLARDLQKKFPRMTGVSSNNLWRAHNYIICKSKDNTTVEFALRDVNKPIGVATYSFTKTLPKELSAFFPSPEELVLRVESVIQAAKAASNQSPK